MKPVKTAKIRTTESGIFPNPFTNTLNWNIKTESEDVVNVQLFDLSGKCVYQQTQTLFEGNNRILLEGLDQLAQGTYLFVASGNNTLIQSKVIKF